MFTKNAARELNHLLTIKIAELIIVALLCAIFIRPLFANIHHHLLLLEIADLFLICILYAVLREKILPNKWEVTFAISFSVILTFPLIAVTGGVNSQITYFLPLLPIMAALIGGKKESFIVTIILIFVTLVSMIFSEYTIDLDEEFYSKEKTISRGFWLIFAMLFSAYFGQFFLTKYTELTSQLKDENLQDPLTKLLNRRGLSFHLENEFKNTSLDSPLSLLLIDIDHFKKINDQY